MFKCCIIRNQLTHFYAFFYNVAGHRYAHVDDDDNLAHLQLGKEDEQMNRLITLELPEDKVFEVGLITLMNSLN